MAALLPAVLAAQETPVFRSDTSLALVRFHVVRKEFYATDLKAADILLLEDGGPRQFTLFQVGQGAARTVPVDFLLLFDTSGSVMGSGLLDPLVFKQNLLDGLAQVRIAVYGFNTRLECYSGPTRDYAQLQAAFQALGDRRKGVQASRSSPLQLPPKRMALYGATWIYEAIGTAAKEAAAAPANATRMMLVFSDGFPTTTSAPEDASVMCREVGIPVYPVVLGHQRLVDQARNIRRNAANQPTPQAPPVRALEKIQDQETQIEDFARLGQLTGGRSFDPPEITLDIMRQILSEMMTQVRTEYVVGFTPEVSRGAPRRHRLEIRLRSKDLGRVLGGTRVVAH